MELRMPRFDLPWMRKTPLERSQAELHKVQLELQKMQQDMQKMQKEMQKRAADVETPRIELPKMELPKLKAQDITTAVDDTRKTVGQTVGQVAEQVAPVASQLGREAGKLGKKAGKRGRQIGRELAISGEQGIRTLAPELRALADDVRSVRITRQKRGSDMMPGIALLAGLGTGMAVMYFFDPEQGRRRRSLLGDQITKWSRVTSRTVSGKLEDLRNRSMGMAYEARSQMAGGEQDATTTSAGTSGVAQETPNAAGELAATDRAAETETTLA